MRAYRIKLGWLGGKEELPISSPFGPRKPPTAGASSMHKGIDVAVPVGTAIKAPFGGTLKGFGVSDTAGLYCTLQNGNVLLRFLHLDSCIVPTRGMTMAVVEGMQIGTTGGAKGDAKAGISTGPHLHFEYRLDENHVWPAESALNPIRFMSEKCVSRVNRSVLSEGFTPEIDPVTEEEKTYKVGDMNPLIEVEYSNGDIMEDVQFNSAYQTDDSATEPIVDENTATPKQETDVSETDANGIWQIVKLAMDSGVQDLMIFDATVSIQTGGILGFFNKACQQPLVEFSGDTFGDQYYFLVRRPPFDRKQMLAALKNQNLLDTDLKAYQESIDAMGSEAFKNGQRFEDADAISALITAQMLSQQGVNHKTANLLYTILSTEIINTSISFNNQGIYSWYQYYPQFELAGDEMQYIVPAVFFPEYAAIWGSKALQIQSQYASFKGIGLRDATENGAKSEIGDKRCRTVLDDLKYLIETTAYAPFTRSGTITIRGCRSVKRGMFIQVQIEKGIDEIFYVDAVTQNYSINGTNIQRTTTLQVSHGMVKRFVKEVDKNNASGSISYFDLIDFADYEENRSQVGLGNWREAIAKWKVNRDVFKFFLKRQQFILSGEL